MASSHSFALVTGATKGLGWELTQLLVDQGVSVCGLFGHDQERAELCRQTLKDRLQNAQFEQVDLSAFSQSEQEKINTIFAHQPIGTDLIILNNAIHGFVPGPFHSVSAGELNKHLAMSITSPFLILQKAILNYKRFASICMVNVLTKMMMEESTPNGFAPYLIGKSALKTLGQMAGKELAKFNLKVLDFYPEQMNTDLVNSWPSSFKLNDLPPRTEAVRLIDDLKKNNII